MATSTYNRVHSLRRKGWTPAKIADELGVSRQRVHQLLALAAPPGESHLKHGTATMAARCDCPACGETKARLAEVVPRACAMLREGATLSRIVDETRMRITSDLLETARTAIAEGRPTLLRDLVIAFEETTHLRSVGRPRLAA